MILLTEKIDAYTRGDRWIATLEDGRCWTAKSALAAVRLSNEPLDYYTRKGGAGGTVLPLDMTIILDAFGEYPLMPSTLTAMIGDLRAAQLIVLGRLTARALKETKDA